MSRLIFILSLPLSLNLLAQTAPPATLRVFAPYVDMSKMADRLPAIQKATGLKTLTLAFVVSGNGSTPTWLGASPIASDTEIAKGIAEVRANSADVIIAFGGYDGLELAQTCSDVPSLQAAYQSVVDKYKAKVLDFDIEHTAIEDPISIDRRSQALKALAAANAGIQINFTLPATPAGLTELSLNVMKSAVKYAVPVGVVNLMTMDYGVPVAVGAMGPNAVAAAGGAARQLKSLGLNAGIGITPMIGVNDTPGETFTLEDAQLVVDYALANNSSIVLLAFWSVGRDNGSCSGTVSPYCSGIAQKEWEFTRVFQRFLGLSFGPLSAVEVPADPVYVKTSNRWVGLFGRYQEYASYSFAGKQIEIVDPYHIKLDGNLGMMVTFAEKKEFSGASDLLTSHVEWESEYWRSNGNNVKTVTRNDLSGTRTDLRITEMEIERAGQRPNTIYVIGLASEKGVFVLSICCNQSGTSWAKEIAPSFNLTHRALDPAEVVRVSKDIIAKEKDK